MANNKIIHLSTEVNFSGYSYVQVYCGGSAPVSVTINGTVVNMAPGNPLDVVVTSITGAANVYLIGFKKITPTTIL